MHSGRNALTIHYWMFNKSTPEGRGARRGLGVFGHMVHYHRNVALPAILNDFVANLNVL